MNQRGRCLSCDLGFYLDSNTAKCIAVATADVIQNCRSYTGPTNCSVCNKGFYLDNGACTAIDSPISNCDIQSNSGACLSCQSGYYLSLDSKSCVGGPSGDNCSTYTNIKCSSCDSGYLKNSNNYLYQFLNLSSATFEDDATSLILSNINNDINGKHLKVCQAIQINNCTTYESFNKCRVCVDGFYLNADKQCVNYPFTTIINCEVYSDLTTCATCSPGYYLESANTCIEVPMVDNCAVYNNKDNGRQCAKCNEGFYLLTFNSCVSRKNPVIPNCVTLLVNAEACDVCNVGFRPTDDGAKCLNMIASCELYEPSNVLTLNLSCYKCNKGYFYDINNSSCILGSVANCEYFEKTRDVCSRCANKYYLEGDVCLPHDILLNCDVYHPTLKNICADCDFKTFLFEKDNQCVPVQRIVNCAEYNGIDTCAQCKDGYYLVNNACNQIPIPENCLQRLGAKCGKCLKDFTLEDGICRDSLDYIVNECEHDNVDGTTNFANSKCHICKQNTYPLIFKDAYVCVETAYMATLRGAVTLTNECTHYAPLTGGAYECTKCVDGKYLDNGACVASCANAARATLYKQILKIGNVNGDKLNESLFVERVNVCGPTIENCAIAAPNVIQDRIELLNYQCIKCNTGSIARIEFDNNMTMITDSSDTTNPFGDSPISRAPGLKCYIPTVASAKMVGEIDNTSKSMANCDYYKKWGSITGCTKCAHGFTGVVLDVVNACDIYINDPYTCKQCKQGHYLATAFECKQVVQIEFCTNYSTTSNTTTCIQCSSTKFLNGNICSSRVNSLNVLNSTLTTNADNLTCTTSYFKDTSSSPFKCVLMNTNCINGSMVSNAFVCNECNHTNSFFNGTTKLCVTGSKTNCSTYDNTANTCVTCINNYYLSSGSCIANTSPDTNCTTWSGSTRNTCTTCNDQSILFTVSNKCRSVTTNITNCLAYDSLTTCSTCAAGTRLENLKTRCLTIPNSDKCAVSTVMDYNLSNSVDVGDAPTTGVNAGIFYYTCDKCNNNTSRLTRKNVTRTDASTIPQYECFSELSYKLDQCATNNITGVENFANVACTSCNTGYYPRNWADKYMCIENTYFSLHTTASITNCERMKWDSVSSKYVCTRCTYPYFIQTDYTCALTCPANFHGVFSDFTSAASGAINVVSLAKEDSTCVDEATVTYEINNCLIYSSNFDFSGVVCIKCKDNFIPVISYADKPVLIDGYTSTTGRPVSPISVHPSINSCDAMTHANSDTVVIEGTTDISTNMVANCKYYFFYEKVATVFYYGCARCKYGNTGKVMNYTLANASIVGYITSCDAMTGTAACSATYTDKDNAIGLGLNSNYIDAHLGLTKYFSCLSCTTANYIPFAFVKSGTEQYNIGNLKAYDLANAGLTYDAGTITTNIAGMAVQCIEAYIGGASQTATSLITTSDDFPLNCALGVVNVDSDKDATDNAAVNLSATTKLAAYCVACNPGFAPTFMFESDGTTIIYNAIKTCTAITDCTTAGTWFNSCSDCVHYYDIYTNTIDYTKCISSTPANCFAAYDVGPCVICEKGYDKDKDGVCVQEHVPVCTMPNNNRNFRYYFNDNTLDIGTTSAYFFGEDDEPGCRACPANYLLTKLNANGVVLYDTNLSKYVCNDFKSEPNHANKPSEANCATYGVVGTNIVCKSCNANYIVTNDNECKLATLLGCNVIKATDGFTCITCDTLYLNVGGNCILKTALASKNCSAFDDSSLLTYAKCTACTDGHVLRADNTACDVIDQTLYPNCIALTGGVCSECDPLYGLATLANTVKYCYPLYTGANLQFDTNCTAVNMTNFNNKQLTCTQCKANYLLEAGNNDYPTHCATFYRNVVDNCKDYYSTGALSTASLKCNSCTSVAGFHYKTATFQCIARTAITNCATYDTNRDRCSVCADNYLLSQDAMSCTALPGAIVSPNRAPNGGYIQKCLSMSTCSSRVKYSGLNPHLFSLFSCHKCAATGLIPLVVVRAGETFSSIEGINEFGFNPTAGQRYDTKTGESLVTCVSPVRATFNIDAGKFNFPTNCGAAILNANSIADATSSAAATNVDKTKVAVMCVACAPGFSATKALDTSSVVVPYMVSSCATITNCESSLWFSACSQCKSNFSYGYTNDIGVLYDRCISYSANPNCFAVDNSDANNIVCKFCRKGYYLNRDGYCELVHPPRCGYSEFRFKRFYANYDFGTGLFLSNDGIGCQKCDDGFVGLFNAAGDRQICTQSPYHTNGLVTANSKFIPFCKNYAVGNDNEQSCMVCQDNYILTLDGKCVASTSIPNCTVSYSSDSCYMCNAPFVLVNRKCVSGTITNCVSYGNNEFSSKQICTKCDKGYYLNDNICTEGSINNCQEYATRTICNRCDENYGLVKSKENFDYCYPIDSTLNCNELDFDSLQNGRIQCKNCISNDYIISTDQTLYKRNLCMAFNPLDNCLKYDTNPNIQDSSFICVLCATGFYLKNGSCSSRSVLLEQCKTYIPDSDFCEKCAPGYFLASKGAACIAFPNGISGCRTYLSQSACLGCNADMYLKNNKCLTVDAAEKIANCVYYDDPQTCNECQPGYIVIEGKCEVVKAQNCATYENQNACESCPSGFGLKLVAGLLNCVQKNIQNCLISEDIEPYECLVCVAGYYVNAGACVAVPAAITNCTQYISGTTCAKCDAGSVLSVNGTACLKTTDVVSALDTNCSEAKLTDELICNSCKPGYIFVNGLCSACSQKTLAGGCYVCNPENPNVCLMCAPGFYQYNSSKCVKNGLKPDEQEEPETPESFAIVKAIAIAIMMMIFV